MSTATKPFYWIMLIVLIFLININPAQSLIMLPSSNIEGHVTDSITGDPLPQAQLELVDAGYILDSIDTDADGYYFLSVDTDCGLPGIKLNLSLDGYTSQSIPVNLPCYSTQTINITLESDATALDPVIIVPGILGSWFKDGEWQLDPILRTYDDLYQALFLAGYVPDETLFAFPYEWRQDNTITAYQLKQKIEDIKISTGVDKVDIVAHSMGGLVTRSYVESDDYQNDIDQIIFLGTPHRGSPEAYPRWEAADGFFTRDEKLMKTFFRWEASARGYDSLFEYLQNYIKSLEQLLPVYPYLKDQGQIQFREYDSINYPDNYPYNFWLENLNSSANLDKLSNSGVSILNITGNTGDHTINAIEVSSGEPYLPLWEHGYAENYIELSGDNTVPAVSSSLFTPTVIDNATHRELPTKAQQQIIDFLTGNLPAIAITDTPAIEDILVVQVYSPVDFYIIDPDDNKLGADFDDNQIEYGFYSGADSEHEFVTILNPKDGRYQIIVEGTANGLYDISASYVTEDELTDKFVYNIPIELGGSDSFDFNLNTSASEPALVLDHQNKITPQVLIDTINECYASGCITKKAVKNNLIKAVQKAEKWYNILDKVKSKNDNIRVGEIAEYLQTKFLLKAFDVKLNFYLKKGWITDQCKDSLYHQAQYIISNL